MATQFKVIISARNCLQWLPRCLDSIAAQSYRHFDLVIVDDQSTEEGQWEWTDEYCRKQGWLAIRKEKRGGILSGLIQATQAAHCREEEVIVHVDGDDWLAHNEVFARLNSIYSRGKVDLTYGQFIHYPINQEGYPRPYPKEVVEHRSYRRDYPIRWGHLRTFKAFLWNAIRDSDLRAPNGDYFQFATDHAFMNPLLEMVGSRFHVIDEVLYVYNRTNPLAETRSWGKEALETIETIRQLPPYPLLDRCRDGH